MAAVQDILRPSGTETSKTLKDSEECGKSTRNGETLEPSDQDRMVIFRTMTPKTVRDAAEGKRPTETNESQESAGMAAGPDMEGSSGAEITEAPGESKVTLTESEKTRGSAGQVEVPGSPRMATDQGMEVPSRTEILEKSATTQINQEILEPSDQDTMGPSRTETCKTVIDSEEDKGFTETNESQESAGITEGLDIEGSSGAEITNSPGASKGALTDSEKTRGSAGQGEIPGTDKDTEGPSGEEISEKSATTQKNQEILEPSDQDMMGLSKTEISKTEIDSAEHKGSTETMESQESAGIVEGPDMEGSYEAEITKALIEAAESEESIGDLIVSKKAKKPGKKTTETTEEQMEEMSVPLNSQTGALVQVQDLAVSPQSFLQQFRSFLYYCSAQTLYCLLWPLWYYWRSSQTQNDETAKNPDNAKTAENRNDECDSGSKGDNEEFEELQAPGDSGSRGDNEEFEEHEAPASNYDTKESFERKIGKMREIMLGTCSTYWYFQRNYHTVGIFSRSSESDYKWLLDLLQSQPFHNVVSIARPHYISNNGRSQFMEDVSHCTFGILYHTKNRGRINIVDVTDSLYDEELQNMSEWLGGNVIVVVDDLEDTSDKMRSDILNGQPSITKLAREIFLFSTAEKKAMNMNGEVPEEP